MSPSSVAVADRASFKRLVRAGGQVNPATFPSLFDKAHALAFAHIDGELIGVAALKRPNDAYRNAVFRKANATCIPEEFPLELGWVFVAREARRRGVAGHLFDRLLPTRAMERVYATSAVDNEPMRELLGRFRFVMHGKPYDATRNASRIQLFVAM